MNKLYCKDKEDFWVQIKEHDAVLKMKDGSNGHIGYFSRKEPGLELVYTAPIGSDKHPLIGCEYI